MSQQKINVSLTPEQVKAIGVGMRATMGKFSIAAEQLGNAMAVAARKAAAVATSLGPTPEELADAQALAERGTFTADNVVIALAQVKAVRASVLTEQERIKAAGDAIAAHGKEPMLAAAKVFERSLARAEGDAKFAKGIPLNKWTKAELMAQLPLYVKDTDNEKLSTKALMCLTQYTADNCSNKAQDTYDHALQELMVPQLLRRMLVGTGDAPSSARMAWELYRTGGATLEEITPMMDAALAELPSTAPVKTETEPLSVPAYVPPFHTWMGTGQLPSVGDLVKGRRDEFRVKATKREGGKNMVSLKQTHPALPLQYREATFWVEWQ